MPYQLLRTLIILLSASLLVACGDGGSESNNGEGAMSLEEFVIEAETTHCEKSFDCCTDAQRSEELGYAIESIDECPEAASVPAAFAVATFQASVNAGRIDLDQDVIDACLETLSGLSCSNYPSSVRLANFPECEGALAPQVDIGGTCTTSQDCKAGSCAFSNGADEGTCQMLPGDGDPCPNLDCAEGLYCESFDEICVPKEPEGEPCFDDTVCISGNCETGEQGNKTCAAAESNLACQG